MNWRKKIWKGLSVMKGKSFKRSHFLTTACAGFLGFIAFGFKNPSDTGKPKVCRGGSKLPVSSSSNEKFLSAFKKKNFSDLPTNPVSY